MDVSPEVYESLLDSVGDGIYFLDMQRRIVYWNRAAERIAGYGAEEVVGSSCKDNILVHVDEQGRSLCREEMCPAHKSLAAGLVVSAGTVYLHHKNGERVAVVVRTSPLRDNQGRIVGAVEVFRRRRAPEEEEAERRRLADYALLDEKTGLGNEKLFQVRLELHLAERLRHRWPLGVLAVKIDDFEAAAKAMDEDLATRIEKMVGRTLQGALDAFDTVARRAPGLFLCVVPGKGGVELGQVAEKARVLVSHTFVMRGQERIGATVSIGGALAADDDTPETLRRRAEATAEEAAQAGGDRELIGM